MKEYLDLLDKLKEQLGRLRAADIACVVTISGMESEDGTWPDTVMSNADSKVTAALLGNWPAKDPEPEEVE